MDLALNNLQRLICHKTQQTEPNLDIFLFYLNLKVFFFFVFCFFRLHLLLRKSCTYGSSYCRSKSQPSVSLSIFFLFEKKGKVFTLYPNIYRLGRQNTPTASLLRGKTCPTPTSVLDIIPNNLMV